MSDDNSKALQDAVSEMEAANKDGLALLTKIQGKLADFDLRYKRKLVSDDLKVLRMAKDILEEEKTGETAD
ncbi:MAG: hypothetical protein WC745_01890 [Patescibacteria group bacterium]|jgi:hypothetical protein